MKQKILILKNNQDQIKAFCKKNYITKLSLFGSALTGRVAKDKAHFTGAISTRETLYGCQSNL